MIIWRERLPTPEPDIGAIVDLLARQFLRVGASPYEAVHLALALVVQDLWVRAAILLVDDTRREALDEIERMLVLLRKRNRQAIAAVTAALVLMAFWLLKLL